MAEMQANIAPNRVSWLIAAAVIVACATFIHLMTPVILSNDLYAAWLAGTFYSAGDLGNIYPSEGAYFTMYPPQAWIEYDRALGGTGALFPFIYPPIWAALMAPLTHTVSFATIVAVASPLNALLMAGTIALAWKAAAGRLGFLPFMIIGVTITHYSWVGAVAILENQPQILVSFLLVLTVERLRAGDDRSAGAALALAAAIKVYPVAFALFFVATRNWRAIVAFVIVGGGLGLLSLLIAGWPLHAAYLSQLSLISSTALFTPISYNFDALAAHLFRTNDLILIPSLSQAASGAQHVGWWVLPKGPLWMFGSQGIMALTVAMLCLGMANANRDAQLRYLWPLSFAALTIVSPISWVYYLLPVMAFLPVLIDRFGKITGAFLVFVLTAPYFNVFAAAYMHLSFVPVPLQLVGTFGLFLIICTFALAAILPKAGQTG